MKISLTNLIQAARSRTTQLENRRTSSGAQYTKTRGYHFYGHLELDLRVSAAEDDADARKHLEILQAFTTVAERAGKEYGMIIFEVQGERIHLFLETDNPAGEKQLVLDFARVWNAGVNAVVKPKAGDAFKSFCMTTDAGSTLVLLSSGNDASESVISLGNAANRPAKHFSRWTGAKNGHVKINVTSLKSDDADEPAVWEDHDVSEPPRLIQGATSLSILNRVTESIDPVIAGYLELSAKEIVPVGHNPVNRPVRKQGFAFRADLDGFSKRVQAAMASTDQAQQALVDEFDQIMKDYPSSFADTIKGEVTTFAWAGDCVNLFLEPELDFETAQTFMPATAAHAWHKMAHDARTGQRPSAYHKWVVGVLGGEDGYVLMARVYTEHRQFAVASGWPWGRSLDAYQASGTAPEDTVIAVEDRSALDARYAEPFDSLDSRFERASFEKLDRVVRDVRREPAKSVPQPFYIGTKKEEHPAQAPHCDIQ